MTELERVIKSLENVLARGHGLIPVPHRDLRLLVEAAKKEAAEVRNFLEAE